MVVQERRRSGLRVVGAITNLHRRAGVALKELTLVRGGYAVETDIDDVSHSLPVVPPHHMSKRSERHRNGAGWHVPAAERERRGSSRLRSRRGSRLQACTRGVEHLDHHEVAIVVEVFGWNNPVILPVLPF